MKESAIKKRYKSGFQSSPIPLDKEDLAIILKNDCKCTSCYTSIAEMDDFPVIRDGELFCESCHNEKHCETCPICEDTYEKCEVTESHIVINEATAAESKLKPGIYQVERPFYIASMISGFDRFIDDSLKLVSNIRINFYKELSVGDGFCPVMSGHICENCLKKYTRDSFFINHEGTPILLLKKYENDPIFGVKNKEMLQKTRQKVINKRITCRGLIQKSKPCQTSKKY